MPGLTFRGAFILKGCLDGRFHLCRKPMAQESYRPGTALEAQASMARLTRFYTCPGTCSRGIQLLSKGRCTFPVSSMVGTSIGNLAPI